MLRAPVDVLLGVPAAARAALEAVNVRTVFDLAASELFATAALLLAAETDPTLAESRLNVAAADAVSAPPGIPIGEWARRGLSLLARHDHPAGRRARHRAGRLRRFATWRCGRLFVVARTLLQETFAGVAPAVADLESPGDLQPTSGSYATERVFFRAAGDRFPRNKPIRARPRSRCRRRGPDRGPGGTHCVPAPRHRRAAHLQAVVVLARRDAGPVAPQPVARARREHAGGDCGLDPPHPHLGYRDHRRARAAGERADAHAGAERGHVRDRDRVSGRLFDDLRDVNHHSGRRGLRHRDRAAGARRVPRQLVVHHRGDERLVVLWRTRSRRQPVAVDQRSHPAACVVVAQPAGLGGPRGQPDRARVRSRRGWSPTTTTCTR